MLVRAKVRCFIDNSLREEGDEFNYDGPENPNVEAVEESAKRGRKAKEE